MRGLVREQFDFHNRSLANTSDRYINRRLHNIIGAFIRTLLVSVRGRRAVNLYSPSNERGVNGTYLLGLIYTHS